MEHIMEQEMEVQVMTPVILQEIPESILDKEMATAQLLRVL